MAALNTDEVEHRRVYDDVLVPTDGSTAARQAIRHAVDIADRYDATIHALYVKDTSAYASLEGAGDSVLSAMESEGTEAIGQVRDAADRSGVETVAEIGEGAPHETIVMYAEENGVDLIAMGTNGRSGLERYVLGSVTERVVRTSPVPVLTVRHTESE